MLKSLLARLWAAWGLLSFVSSFLLILLPSMMSHLYRDERKGQLFFMQVSRIWMRCWLTLIGCRLHIRGAFRVKKGKVFIVVFNHRSLLDVPLSAPFVPGGNKTIGKISFARVPLFGWFYKRGAVLVDRQNERSRRKSYEQMRRVLRLGIHMCIYPEGTRNRSNEPLKPFFDGAFRLSKETGVPILPCIIRGTAESLPIDRPFYLWPHALSMEFLDPISPEEYQTVADLKQATFNKMRDSIVSEQTL
jgi:1-acyl-sn-glycerol-3-phosphate acyltransferase